MIKKFAAVMSLSLILGLVGMVPASAATNCDFSGNDLSLTIDTGDASIAVDDDGKVWCDNSDDAFSGSSDDVEDIEVTGTGDLFILLDDNDGNAADWSDLGDIDIEIDGDISFNGDAVEDDDLDVTVTDDEFTFNGINAAYDDDDVSTILFDDGDESDVFDASSARVEVDVTLDSDGHDVARGGLDHDTVNTSGDASVTVYGNAGNDTLTDTNADTCDTFYGGSGNDDITMDSDDDCDVAFPGTGNDDLDGVAIVSYADLTAAVSIIEDGDDTETGLAAGNDEFASDPEVFKGTNYGDTLVSLGGKAVIYGLGGDDTIRSFSSKKLFGGAGNDLLVGSNDSVDYLYGGAGSDTLRGRGGNDYLFGGAGRDTIYGGLNSDVCDGEVLYTCEFIR